MFGGIIAIGVSAVIYVNRDRIVAKLHKSDSLAWGFTLSGVVVILIVAHLYLMGGR